MNVIETLKSIYYSEDESEDILLDIRKKLKSQVVTLIKVFMTKYIMNLKGFAIVII